MKNTNKTFEVVKDNLNTKVYKLKINYAVVKINWRFSNLSEISYLHHNSDHLFNNKENAEMVCNALNDKRLEDTTFMVIEIPPKK